VTCVLYLPLIADWRAEFAGLYDLYWRYLLPEVMVTSLKMVGINIVHNPEQTSECWSAFWIKLHKENWKCRFKPAIFFTQFNLAATMQTNAKNMNLKIHIMSKIFQKTSAKILGKEPKFKCQNNLFNMCL